MIIIDGKNAVLGRLATYAAKEALKGEDIAIVNAEKIAITGKLEMVVREYDQKRKIKDIANPLKGPFLPRRPDIFVKRTMQGMLPKRNSGKQAMMRIKAYMGEPAEVKGKVTKMPECKVAFSTVEDVCRALGWKP